MIYLERKNKIYSKYSFDNSERKNINKSSYRTIEGYRFKTRQKFTSRAKTNLYRWIIQHIHELYILFSEIGIINTIRYLNYVTSPKVIYVDAIKVKDSELKENIYIFSKGIILKDAYTKSDINLSEKQTQEISNDSIARKFTIEDLLSEAKTIKDISSTKININSENMHNNWLVAGSGNFASSILIPSILNSGGKIIACCSNSGASSFYLSKAFAIPNTYSSIEDMISENLPAKNILIATPPVYHPEHIRLAIEANLKIYSEKPVAVSYDDISNLEKYNEYENIMIGFNRRFAPSIQELVKSKEYKDNKDNLILTYIVNLGEFSVSMATKEIGGGTTVGSCCHYLDLIEYICDSDVVDFHVNAQADNNDGLVYGSSFSCILKMRNGCTANLIFKRSLIPSNGVKELISIVGENLNANVFDFKKLTINGKQSNYYLFSKGWKGAMTHFHQNKILKNSSATCTLLKGNRITKLAMNIDDQIEKARL